jgi:hypothetical protein
VFDYAHGLDSTTHPLRSILDPVDSADPGGELTKGGFGVKSQGDDIRSDVGSRAVVGARAVDIAKRRLP